MHHVCEYMNKTPIVCCESYQLIVYSHNIRSLCVQHGFIYFTVNFLFDLQL